MSDPMRVFQGPNYLAADRQAIAAGFIQFGIPVRRLTSEARQRMLNAPFDLAFRGFSHELIGGLSSGTTQVNERRVIVELFRLARDHAGVQQLLEHHRDDITLFLAGKSLSACALGMILIVCVLEIALSSGLLVYDLNNPLFLRGVS